MKIIISRKGFDSSNGWCPSPILPDGTLLSLPIPSKKDCVKYTDLYHDGKSVFEIIKEINPKTRIKEHWNCHLDPDIRDYGIVEDWLPLFGQEGSSQKHLENQRIGKGDVFLFFGWFRQTERVGGKLRFVKTEKEKHILWGYFQVNAVFGSYSKLPPQFHYHPHATFERYSRKNNCIYSATERLSICNAHRGYGTFKYHPSLVLTKDGLSRSKWQLPEFFKDVQMSYHSSKSFKEEGYFDSAKIGQEFVVSEDGRVTDWALSKITIGKS
jgi:hypothetical protein